MCYKLECNFSSFSMEAFIPLIIDYWGHKMLCLLIAVDRSSIFSIQLRALMKMKTVGDIFTASFVGGRGGVNIALTLQISLRGWGKKKTYVHRLVCSELKEIFQISLQEQLFITSICFLCSRFKAITFLNLPSRGPLFILGEWTHYKWTVILVFSFSARQRSTDDEGAERSTNSWTQGSGRAEWWNSTAWLWKKGQYLPLYAYLLS